ncbi:lipocalin family protein [Dyella sp. GSA-30]|uniref:lipocalin family protein n=1 Tax=Dyella sp. GSA-30 TaxID=2994496 RepID=UPI0024937C57|nr:lipocalin family protein [Dyella sp. GSA-30]BDU21663.1 outer membrane lipoprotein [Dyella sp. GSA-30]
MNLPKKMLLACGIVLVCACVHAGSLPPIKPVEHVDLPRFMGDWYVIATIPTRFEKNAYNAVETYKAQPDGNIYTAFRFNNGSYEGPVKAIHSTAFVKAGSGNAVWGVQVFWPVKAQYIVAYLKEDYSQTIVARDARDYTWVMARTPTISQADYDALMVRVVQLGYSLQDVRKVPQQRPDAQHPEM